MENIESKLRLKNRYDDRKERISFEITGRKCEKEIDLGVDCIEKPEALEQLLDKFYFSVYYIDDYMKDTPGLGNDVKLYKSFDSYHSSFQLKIGKYRSNHNYMKYHRISTAISRYGLFFQ